MKNSVKINDVTYIIAAERHGYGYYIRKIEIIAGRKKYTDIFHSYDRDTIKKVFSEFQAGITNPTFPDTSDEIPEPKVLELRRKHWTDFFQVNTLEEYKRVATHIVQEGYENGEYCEVDAPTNDSSVTCDDDLNKLPEGKLRDYAEKLWKEYNEKLRTFNIEHRGEWNNVLKVVNNEGGNPIRALEYVEVEYIQLHDVKVL